MAGNAVKIAVDGMGGDRGPRVAIDGAVMAANQSDYELVLVGREDIIKRELSRHRVIAGRISVVHASEIVGMEEAPVQALKKKKDSSIAVGMSLLHERKVDAFVSAGNTGAVVASATIQLGLLEGIKRAGIAITYPTIHGISLLMDVGANINVASEHLLQYAIMADAYAQCVLGKKRPAIGLLNIGEEESKGTDVMKEAYKLLRDSSLNFIGNVEGRDFFTGKADCIICDGFVGNIVLKMCESILETVVYLFQREMTANPISKIGALLCKPAMINIRRTTNYEEAGGAPLLGVDGHVIISHGASSAKAISSGVKAAGQAVESNINEHIVSAVASQAKPQEYKPFISNHTRPAKEAS